METCDVVLLIVAAYVATSGLARLMIRRRDELLDEFHGRMQQGGEKKPRVTSKEEPGERRAA